VRRLLIGVLVIMAFMTRAYTVSLYRHRVGTGKEMQGKLENAQASNAHVFQ
jgi:hypothetical protein